MPAARKTNWFGWIFLLVVLAAAGAGGWFWYKKRNPELEITYRTSPISKADIIQSVTASGQLNPMINVQVGSQVSGIIDKIFVDFNSKVTNGQLLAQIDPATYKARLIQAEAELANAKASQELMELNAKRATELNKSGLLARSEYDKAKVDLHQAEAAVKIREASLESAKVDLARTSIYSPIDGIVISRNIDVGQTVAASFSAPILFLIANDLAKMQINALVSEADLGGVETNQNVTFITDAYPTGNFKGKVVQVRNAPITNQNVVSYDTIIEVDNSELKLKPGMTANVSIILSNRSQVLTIPNGALRFKVPEGVKVTGQTNAAAQVTAIKMIDGQTNYVLEAMPEQFQGFAKPFDKNKDGLISPDEGAAMRAAMMERFASQGGGGGGGEGGGRGGRGMGGGMFGGRGGSAQSNRPRTQTVYLLESTNKVAGQAVTLKAVQVKVGISDGVNTEVLEGLKEGEQVVVGSNAPPPEAPRTGMSSPMGSPFGGGSRRGFSR